MGSHLKLNPMPLLAPALLAAVLLAAVLPMGACSSARGPQIAPQTPVDTRFEFAILQANDVYEISPLDRGRIGGMARVATVLRDLERRAPHTIAVLAGDFVSPSLISSLSRVEDGEKTPIAGEQMVALMNAVGFDYVTFGNHEFDISEESLLERIEESEFSYVAANVRHGAGDAAAPFERRGEPIPDYAVHTFTDPDGRELRLGLVGLTLPFNQASYVSYEDPLEAGERAYAAAAAESDLVFALTHLSLDLDRDLARRIPELPLILGGHDHINTKVSEGTTRIAKADANARTVYLHWVTYDTADGSVEVWSQLLPITDDIPNDPEVEALVEAWEATAEELIRDLGYDANSEIGDFAEPFDGREASVRTQQTNLGQSIACAMRAADTLGSDLAFLNAGSIRIDDTLVGSVQQRDVLRTLPFGGEIVHGRMRGEILEMVLDVGFGTNFGEGGYLQLTPNVVPTEQGYAIDGEPLDPGREYRVTLPSFLSEGLEDNLGFLADEASYEPLDDLRGVDGSVRNDLRDIWMLYLLGGAACHG
jgi:5'-nucleotidase